MHGRIFLFVQVLHLLNLYLLLKLLIPTCLVYSISYLDSNSSSASPFLYIDTIPHNTNQSSFVLVFLSALCVFMHTAKSSIGIFFFFGF